MSDEPIHVSYAEGFSELVDTLKNLERPGHFQISGKHETPMPVLSVDGVGQLSFPVPAEQARALISAAAERAPYGKGEQTLVDESVRKVWQIAPSKITLDGKGWTTRFQEMVARVAEGLGLLPKDVKAEFYKFLIYDAGGFFLPHRDTEKAGGMFGTLVVTLPSAHEGGELIVRHAGREEIVDLRGTDPGEVGFAAFYADCEHEVRPIVSGYRVCLIFNLVLNSRMRGSDPQPLDERPYVQKASSLLQNWAAQSEAKPNKIAWLLDHKYTTSGLSFSSLKGRDAAVAKVLFEAAKSSSCAFHLGIVHIEESGWAEYNGWGDSRWDDDNEDDEYGVGEVCDSFAYIDGWMNARDEAVNFGRIPLEDNEVLPPDALEGEEPDEIQFSEATGNAGADFERAYLRAAVIIWPEAFYNSICLSVGTKAAVARLQELVQAGDKTPVEQMTQLICENWKNDEASELDQVLRALTRHGEQELLYRTMSDLLLKSYTGVQNEAVVEAVKKLTPGQANTILEALIEQYGSQLPCATLDLWNRLASEKSLDYLASKQLEKWLEVLGRREPGQKLLSSKKSVSGIDSKTLDQFMGFLSEPRFESALPQVVALLERVPDFLDVEQSLLPALEKSYSRGVVIPSSLANTLWSHAADYFLKRSETPPPAPVDWAQNASPDQYSTQEIHELVKFARDPIRRVCQFRAKKEVRQQLHLFIDRLGLDMTHITERKGSPYTLVCTKTRATYERACQRYSNDIAAMKRLLALLPASDVDLLGTTDRLRLACGT